MYLICGKETQESRHCWILSNTRKKAIERYQTEVEDIEDDMFEDCGNNEQIIIDHYNRDNIVYITKLPEPEGQTKLWILEFNENESYHNESYVNYSYELDNVIADAVNYFENESEDTTLEAIDEMKKKLVKYGYYAIPEGRTYCCGLMLYSIKFE
jgi:hypothetical protein